jgi:predicted MPP superfamily phosphohydrolase
VLEQIKHFRAYTAYRLHSLIIEQLEQTIKTSGAKLVVISDIMCPFLTENIDDQEARTAYNQIINYLSNFAKQYGIIIVATNLPHENTSRNRTLHEISTTKAGILFRLIKTPYTSDIELEKHPSYMLGVMEFRPETKPLTAF